MLPHTNMEPEVMTLRDVRRFQLELQVHVAPLLLLARKTLKPALLAISASENVRRIFVYTTAPLKCCVGLICRRILMNKPPN